MREGSHASDDTDTSSENERFEVVTHKAQQLELFEMDEIVRPDYNIGKYATFLFASPYLKNLDDHRRMEIPIKGEKDVVASIEVHPLKDQIVPTTTTFKVLMGLIQLWQMQGANPSGTIGYSDRQLAQVIGWSFSGKTARKITNHLDILQGTTIDWVLSFQSKDKTERAVRKMSLLTEVSYIKRSEMLSDEKFQSIQTVTLHQNMVQNMLDNKVRPINFEALRQISSDASTRLYMMLDMYLAKKAIWERRAEGLLRADLGYQGQRYDNRGERKRTLERLINDLDGKELTNGKLALKMTATKDKTDWKLVARKVKRIERKRPIVKAIRNAEDAEFLADDLLQLFDGVGAPKRGFMVFLCTLYPEPVLRDALSRAKGDYQGNVRKSLGAIFRYELEQIVKGRGDLTWYKPEEKID